MGSHVLSGTWPYLDRTLEASFLLTGLPGLDACVEMVDARCINSGLFGLTPGNRTVSYLSIVAFGSPMFNVFALIPSDVA